MKVFKFGGASTDRTERIPLLADILRASRGEKILVVVSAMGKTTNALEKVVNDFFAGASELAAEGFRLIGERHRQTARILLQEDYSLAEKRLQEFIIEGEWLLASRPVNSFDYYYDQLVCLGELFSSVIISQFLQKEDLPNHWLDVRDVFRTDNNFRDANIHWQFTEAAVRAKALPQFDRQDLVVTQGFIGATDENESTTLGREGSDYSAAVFAHLLNAEDLTIWKDVEGVMNADPKIYPDATLIRELNYDEVIEMAYYGAQVIHPKTIKPLQNKDIPLYVRCFLDQRLPGTVIHGQNQPELPPIIVRKEGQILLLLHAHDYSFVGEKLMAELYQLFSELRIKPNLIQSAAVSLLVCLDDRKEKIERLVALASLTFDVELQEGLTLLTIRHYRPETLEKYIEGKEILLRQQSPVTVQVLMR
jgi:aspartate kinase